MKNYLSQPKFSTLGPRANFAAFGVGLRPDEIQANIGLVRTNQFAPKKPGLRGFGTVQTAEQGASVGATVGSAIPVVGTAIGAIVGAVAGSFIHTGQGPQRAAQAQAIDQALASLSTANHQGAQIPWDGTATAPGLQQFLQAMMTSGLWMSWDPSLISSPSVNGNWALTFIAAIKQVVQAIVSSPVGQQVCVNITDKPGGNDAVPGQFCFINPGISVGPDVISQKIIMGNGGLMYWMILRTGETTAHASANANNSAAQKVFALMVDHAAYDLTPAPPPATISTVANAPVAASTGTPAPTVTGTTTSGTPVVAPGDESALIAQLIAQGQSQTAALNAALASMQANNIPVTPQAQAQLQTVAAAAPAGISTNTLLLIGAVGIGALFLMKRS